MKFTVGLCSKTLLWPVWHGCSFQIWQLHHAKTGMWICASLLQKYVCSTCQHFKVQDLNQHTFWIETNVSDLFLFTQILHCEDGVYKEGLQYKVIPGTESKGAYGEAAMCQDQNTSKTFMLKKVWHLVTMVSVISEGDPLCLRCNQLLSDGIWIPAKPSC